MVCFFCIWVGIASQSFDDIEDYWNEFEAGGLRGCSMTYLMPRYKFKQLWSAFRMYDCTKQRSFKKGKYSKIYKVQYFYEQVWAQMKGTWDNGTMNAMDELGIPSRHKWLRHFNPNKPHKYHRSFWPLQTRSIADPLSLCSWRGATAMWMSKANHARRWRTAHPKSLSSHGKNWTMATTQK